jgi:three-Cys-motif partner protein
MIALGIEPSFDRLIFCEKDALRMAALKDRCLRQHPDRNIQFIPGDANENAAEILRHIPQHRRGHGVLTLCFVDPYMLRNLRFATLDALSGRWMDFLVLIPSEMDAQRNEQTYVADESAVISDFVGSDDWRIRWRGARSGLRFGHFVIEEFGRSMEGIGRIKQELHEMWRMKNTVNRELYHLALYSRKELGGKFWREARKAASPNLELGF